MKLKNKISVIILFIWAAMATLFYYGSQKIILNSYVRLENQTVTENLDRTQATLEQIINAIEHNVQDWAIWDDTYQFIADQNQRYLKSTLALSSFQSINIDLVLFFDEHGKLIKSIAVNKDRTKEVPLPAGLVEALTPKSKLVYQPNPDSGSEGMISIPSGILLIASHSIVDSDGKGPPRGSLVMARYLTNPVLSHVEHLVKADATLYRVPQSINLPEVAPIYRELLSGKSEALIKTNSILNGYRFLNDVNGKHIAILKVEMPRKIYQIGVETTHYSNLILFIYGVVITTLLWILLQYLIVKRLEKLGKHISKISTNDKFFSKVIENVSDEVSSVAALYHQATHDPLTGLANRSLLHQAFNHFASEPFDADKKIVILFIDLDHFKRINDTLGHDVGDTLLAVTAKRLSSSLRDNDMAARLGGDEFVVMLVDIDKDQVQTITNRIFKSINRPITHEHHDIYISSSMGVCIFPDDGSTIEKLIKQADLALYHAKEHGRKHYQFYSESLNKTISESHQKEIELQNALDEKQLCLYYQPIYDLRTKQIASMEALIRWNHPTHGLLGPDEIIPIAERTELIYPIGEWVFKTVCKQIKTWVDNGVPVVPVAVNISSSQIKQSSLSESIIHALQENNIDTHLLQIEITETGFIDITPKLINELEGLCASGIKLIIDDFGTGYSGLGYLKRLPVSKLKIDKSFVHDIHTDADDKAITLAIIAIAHQLNLKVTAEGVENLDQYNFLCHHQVDEVQGFFLSAPLSADAAEQLLSGEKTFNENNNI